MIGGDSFFNRLRAPAEGIRSQYLCFPERMGQKMHRGHCVLAIGFFEKHGRTYVWMRNSFGVRWGYFGDFCIALDQFDPEQVHSLSYFEP